MSETRPLSRRFGLLSAFLAAVLLCALAMLVWWAVQRIDGMTQAEQSRALTSGLVLEKTRLVAEQRRATTLDAAVVNLRANDQAWIAENLAERMSEFYDLDRVYVVAPDGAVIRAANLGQYAGTRLDPRDQVAVEAMLAETRAGLATASATTSNLADTVSDLGHADLARLQDNSLAFISVQPVLGKSGVATERPGTEYFHVSLRVLNDRLLASLAERYRLADLKIAGRSSNSAALALRNSMGHQLGYLTWTPNRPALTLLRATAPATIAILCMVAAALVGLLGWLRRAASQLEASRAETSFLAFHDPLTGLANRVLFQANLEEALGYQYLAATKVALISIDIDRFKEVNDTLGHAAGDQLLQQVAKRFALALSEGATLTRLAGDEFAIVQPGIVSDGHARWLCQSILQSLKEPFVLSGGSVHVTGSFGVALEPGSAVTPQEMLRRADVALYAAKAAGRNCFEIYTPEMDRLRREKRMLEVELRDALITGVGLFLVYQPIFDAASGEIAGAEALVRWMHPTRGNLSPDHFVAIAEETGVIDQLGLWVLDEASRFAVASGLPRIAVNVSPLQFLDDQFVDRVLHTIARRGLNAAALELEITEGLLLKNSEQVQRALVQLREAGVRIALDDFGTGYSSISYLRSYNVDKLKIDQSFTRTMVHDEATQTIVRSVIQMAHALGMSVTAEGVEEDAQRQILRDLGCNGLQGYLLSRPLTGEALIKVLANGHLDQTPARTPTAASVAAGD